MTITEKRLLFSLPFLPFLLCGNHLTGTGHAQNTTAPPALSNAAVARLVPRPERLEGALSVTQNGVTTRATLRFQAPDSLRVDVARDDAALIASEVFISRGDANTTQNGETARVRRWRFGSVTQPWRSAVLADGGPANIALFGWPQGVETAYAVTATGGAPVTGTASAPATPSTTGLAPPIAGSTDLVVTLTARDNPGKGLVQDFVRSGGQRGQAFYAAFKRAVFDRPARIALRLSSRGVLLSREDFDEAGRMLSRTTFETDAATGLPIAATATDGAGRGAARWRYDLKPRTAPFAADVFELAAAAREQVVEDVELRPLGEYEAAAGATGADAGARVDARYNAGVVLARHLEDFAAAFAAWDEAARLKPRAVAPPLAIYETALRVRDLNRAEAAMARLAQTRLAQLPGADGSLLAEMRANLAVRRRDWPAAQAAFDAAQKAQPQNLGITLTRSMLARLRGDYATARRLLLDILQGTAPQSETQAVAAAALAASFSLSDADKKEAETLLPILGGATPAGATPWQKLARALLALRLERPAEETTFADDRALAVLALAQEDAGQNDAAIASWQAVAARAPGTLNVAGAIGVVAREHLAALHAGRGQAAASLKAYRELVAGSRSRKERRAVQDMLLAAWHKARRGEELKRMLEQRALATAATEDDLELQLAWHEAYGTPERVASAVRAGATRFPRSAWWQSRLAEQLLDEAAAKPDAERERVRQEAVSAAGRAAQLDPAQPYYATQAALILTQRAAAMRNAPVVVPAEVTRAREAASAALDKLAAGWPDDPDIAITVATARDTLQVGGAEGTAGALEQALRSGEPAREAAGGDRHATVFFTRQAMALSARDQGRFDEAARQYETLLTGARDASEQVGIAGNYLVLLQAQASDKSANTGGAAGGATADGAAAGDNMRRVAPAAAALLARLAGEAWPLEAAQSAAASFAEALIGRGLDAKASLALETAALLRGKADAASRLAAAHLHFALERVARQAMSQPDVAPTTERLLRQSQAWSTESAEALKAIAVGDDKMLAARALALLAEAAMLRGDSSEAAQRLTLAIVLEPQSADLRFALARVYLQAGRQAEALATRDDILRTLPRTPGHLRRAALLSARLERSDEALRLASQALQTAQVERTVSTVQAQEMVFTLARLLLSGGQSERATGLYNGLASAQWGRADRAAALIDLEARLRAAGKTPDADRVQANLTALRATAAELEAAQAFLDSLE